MLLVCFIFRLMSHRSFSSFFFFFNDTATTEIYTLSLHDALPISYLTCVCPNTVNTVARIISSQKSIIDRKSTRLNSSHGYISYAVFCLKKKKKNRSPTHTTHSAQPRRPGRSASIASRVPLHTSLR